mgnify:CR=1 FL=1
MRDVIKHTKFQKSHRNNMAGNRYLILDKHGTDVDKASFDTNIKAF